MATAKKTSPKTDGTKYEWYVRTASAGSLTDDYLYYLGSFVSLESVVNSESFHEYMVDQNHPDRVYLLALAEDGKPHRFHRIAVRQSGYTFKEV